VEKVLNHTIDDVAEIYDRHDYAVEKRAALDRLAECLERAFCGHANENSRHPASDVHLRRHGMQRDSEGVAAHRLGIADGDKPRSQWLRS
jgi:hypothetical protein